MKNREQLEAKIDFRNFAGRECTFTPAREKELYSFFKKHQICRRYDFFRRKKTTENYSRIFMRAMVMHFMHLLLLYRHEKSYFRYTGWLFQDPYAARLELNG